MRWDLGKSPLDQKAKMHTPSQIKDLLLGTWTKGEAGTLTELHELKRPSDLEERYARDYISRKRWKRRRADMSREPTEPRKSLKTGLQTPNS